MNLQTFFLSVEKYQGLGYLLLLLLGLYVSRGLWKARKELRESYFGLEREIAMRHLAQWLAAAGLILAFACAIFFIAVFVAPGLPASALIATPTVDLLGAPSGALSAEQAALLLTPFPPAPPAESQGCMPGQVEVTSPRPNEEVSGAVKIFGTVNLPGFEWYKYELALRGTEDWKTIAAEHQAKRGEELGNLNTDMWTPGDYLLRIIVVGNTDQVIGACTIPIRIKGK